MQDDARCKVQWPKLVESCSNQLRRLHGLKEQGLRSTSYNDEEGERCVLVESGRVNKIAFLSRSLETFGGWNGDLLVGRNDLEFLQPPAAWLDDLFNAGERRRLAEFNAAVRSTAAADCSESDHHISLLVSCKRSGAPFWHLLHSIPISTRLGKEPSGDEVKYILHLIVPLEAPVPESVWQTLPGEARLAAKANAEAIRPLLEQLRQEVMSRSTGTSVLALSRVAERHCKGCAELLSDAFQGDLFVPRIGRDAVDVFERLGRREKIFRVLEDEIKTAWEASEEAFRSTAAGFGRGASSIVCSVSDPSGVDCPLVYISTGFEELTGYRSAWVLGRNCRFLQPKVSSLAPQAVNTSEVARMRQFCKGQEGSILCLLLNETAAGKLFWNLLFMEHLTVGKESIRGMGERYIFAVQTELVVQRPLLNELVLRPWELGLGSQRLERLREMFRGREAKFLPREQSLLQLCGDTLEQWAFEVNETSSPSGKGGRSAAGKMRTVLLDDFGDRWPLLVDAASEGLRKIFGLGENDIAGLRVNVPGCVVCCVADPSTKDCPLIYLSRGFEEMTAYMPDHAVGRNCRFLQPSTRGLNSVVNGEELMRLRAFCEQTGADVEGRSIVSLLLNERQTGERFWNLLHMRHVSSDGRPYILGVQTSLDVPMPTMLRTADLSTKMGSSDAVHYLALIEQIGAFLSKMRPMLESKGCDDMQGAVEIATRNLMSFLKNACDDFEGDHWVPLLGSEEASVFQKDVSWKRVLDQVQNSLYKVWEVSHHGEEEVSCCIADPTGDDCPLVYVSAKFQSITGYQRDWVMGRNCRFLQPNNAHVNSAFNKGEALQMRSFCQEPQPKGTRIVNLLVNERKDGYPFWNLLVMEHIEVAVMSRAAQEGVLQRRMERRAYIFGVQTVLDTQTSSLVELLAVDAEGLKQLGRLRQILRSRESTLAFQSLQTFARECVAAWLPGVPAAFSLPKVRLGAPVGWCRGSVPSVGLEVTAQNMLEVVPAALEEGIRHFYLGFSSEERQTADPSLAELQGRLLALRLAELLNLLQPGFFHYLRAGIALTLVTPPQLVRSFDEISKAAAVHGFVIDCWLLDVRALDLRRDFQEAKVIECWQVMSAIRRAGGVGVLGLCGAGRELCDRVQNALGASPIGAFGVENYPGKSWGDVKERIHYEQLLSRGTLVVSYGVFGPRQQFLECEALREEAARLNTDPAVMLMKWAEAQGHAMMVPRLRYGSPRRSRGHRAQEGEVPMAVGDRLAGAPYFHRAFAKEFSKVMPGACAEFFRTFGGSPPDTPESGHRQPFSPPKPLAGHLLRRGSMPGERRLGNASLEQRDSGSPHGEGFSLATEKRLKGVNDDGFRLSSAQVEHRSADLELSSARDYSARDMRGTLRHQQTHGATHPARSNVRAPEASLQSFLGQLSNDSRPFSPDPLKEQRTKELVRHSATSPLKPAEPPSAARFSHPHRMRSVQADQGLA